MAALFVCNPELLARLAKDCGVPVDQFAYPDIPCVVSWYSILDDQSWRLGPGAVDAEEWLNSGLAVVWDMYVSRSSSPPMGGRVTLCEYEAELVKYPPTLLIVGSYDPLGLKHSSIAAHEMLAKRKNLECELKIFNATHGFVGCALAAAMSVRH